MNSGRVSHIKHAVAAHGYAFVPASVADAPPGDLVDDCSSFGTPQRLSGMTSVQVLRPRSETDAPLNIYSGYFGYSKFPLHSDLAHWSDPPPYLVLRCIRGAPNVFTRLVDSRLLIEAFGAMALRRTLVQPRKRVGRAKPLLPLLDVRSDRQFFRWDALFTNPATKASAHTFARIAAFLNNVPAGEVALAGTGDMLVIDNGRMLHGRSPVADNATERCIERLYLAELL